MGRERYWGGRSTKRARDGGERETPSSGCMSAVFQFFDFHQFQLCIHHQQPSFKPQYSFIPEDPSILKGVEAPRNSLDASMGPASLSPVLLMNEEENLNIPRGIQIKTRTSGATRPKVVASHDLSSESTNSPGPKTPNLVARLMGLDLLPDNYSPSLSSSTPNSLGKSTSQNIRSRSQPPCPIRSTTHQNFFLDSHISAPAGTRSLPETPRISSARRSDVDHHRLSLQINKENVSVSSEELECFSRYSNSSIMGKRKEVNKGGNINDENKSPSHYARQIVKQVKESVSRKAGLDITNTVRNKEQRRDGQIMAIKLKKSSRVFNKVGEELLPSSSPRVRFLELKNKSSSTKDQISSQSPKPTLSSLSSSSSSSTDNNNNNQSQLVKVFSKPKQDPKQKPIQKCKNFKKTIRNKQEEPFVRPSTATRANVSDKKCKKRSPLSNGLLNITTVPTLLPVKKDPSPPATKLPQKQSQAAQASNSNSQLSSCASQKYKQKATHTLTARGDNNNHDNSSISSSSSTTSGGGAEFQYVTRILKRTGIENDTPVSFSMWFSPSHPIHPSIFHHLELSYSSTAAADTFGGQLSHRCNRKLIFNLADEILVEILKPYINMKPWLLCCPNSIYHDHHMKGSQLIENLCAKIRSFPSTNCQVLADIDALIDKDLQQKQQPSSAAFEEEGEGIVMEIEREIMDSLVQETVELCGMVAGACVACPYRMLLR